MLQIDNVVFRLGGRTILDGASAPIPAGHKIGLVGRNGAGKSTLLALIAGELSPDAGEIRRPRRCRMAAVAQEAPDSEGTVLDFVLAADRERASLLQQLAETAEPTRIAELHARLDDIAASAAPARAARILAGLGFAAEAQQRALSEFSGGWRMRVALATVLFLEPDLLLLDEPTNYLDLEGVLWLEAHLRRYPHTVLLVSHERDLLNRAVDHILHLDHGRLTLYRGGYDAFEQRRREQQLHDQRLNKRLEAQRRHMQAFVDRFRYKASKARQAQSRLRALERLQPIAAAAQDPHIAFEFPAPAALRPPLLVAEAAVAAYRPDVPVLSRLDFRIDPDDRIALIGPNGNGKTTLARLLAGRLAPLSGSVRHDQKLEVGFFAQHQLDDLSPDDTALQQLARAMPTQAPTRQRAQLGRFGLSQEKAGVRVADLSGGERARLVLAMITSHAPNLLILDEPTNHLDIDAREALIHALNAFDGAVLLISHDRHLVDLVADRLWLVADGTVQPFEGDLEDYRRMLLGGGARAAESAGGVGPRPGGGAPARRSAAKRRAALAPLRARLRESEAVLARLEAERAAIEAKLADPGLYSGAPGSPGELTRRRAELDTEIAAAEAAWLAAAEALEGGERNAAD